LVGRHRNLTSERLFQNRISGRGRSASLFQIDTPALRRAQGTLQLAAAGGGRLSADELVAQVVSKAKFAPADVTAALDALTATDLATRSDGEQVSVTDAGTALISEVRTKASGYRATFSEELAGR
jgi:hypothetical protein